MNKKERPLTSKERKRIWQAISTKTACDDKPAQEVIREGFGGDEERYLRAMAKFHSVSLNTS